MALRTAGLNHAVELRLRAQNCAAVTLHLLFLHAKQRMLAQSRFDGLRQ